MAEVAMPTRAVLFDFDGILADTENVHIAAWQRTLRAMGWHEPEETCLRAAAIDDRAFVQEVFARRKIEGGDTLGWARRKQDLTLRLLRDRPRLQPGAAELTQALREAGIALAVVTMTRRANVETVLAASGLLDAFDLIVAGDDSPTPKSDPELYRRVVEGLDATPADAVALEESASGLVAAERAGLRVVAVLPNRPSGDWSGASAGWLPNLSNLPATLATLGL